MRHMNSGLVLALPLMLAACAAATTPPKIEQALTIASDAPPYITQVTVETDPGVWASDSDCDDIRSRIESLLSAQRHTPGANATTPAYRMRVNLSRFKKGSAGARMMLIGLGQIHIEGQVTLIDASGAIAGQYKITKALVAGGIVGAVITPSDVENGFAKSVVAAITPKPATSAAHAQ